MKNHLNDGGVGRRDFLTLTAGLIATVTLDAVLGPGTGFAADVTFREARYEGEMEKKVLVAYASKYGSTGGVADAIGKELNRKGTTVDVALTGHVRDPSSYRGVVVGSAIYMGKWLSDAADFVKENRATLQRVPVAYFLVCMTLSEPTEKGRVQAMSYMDPILKSAPEIKPVAIGTFAGALNYTNLSWLNRKILKSKGTPEGDFRDWNAIRDWAREPVCTTLLG